MAQPSGTIYLMKNVPLLPSYEHTIDFKDRNEQQSFFMGFVAHTLEFYSYIRKERETITVEMNMNDLDSYNYMMFRSESDGRLYYAFIKNKVYLNPHTSIIYFEIDVFQTYMFDFKWNPSYISKAHVDRWTAQHKPIYSLTDEGLDYGAEYSVETAFRIEQDAEINWAIVSLIDYSPILSEGHIPTTDVAGPASSPFYLFLVPIIRTDVNENIVTVTVQNEEGIGVGVADFIYLMNEMKMSALGNYIRSINLLSYNPFVNLTKDADGWYSISFKDGVEGKLAFLSQSRPYIVLSKINPKYFSDNILAETEFETGIEHGLPTSKEWEEIKQKPYTTPRDKRFESKLLCSPYRYNILTDWRNSPVIFKNEYMPDDKIAVKFSFALSTTTPFRYWLEGYKRDPEGRITSLTQSMALDFPIISDAYYTYMLENKNTIQANLTNGILSAGTGIVNGIASSGAIGGGMGLFNGIVNVAQQQISENAKQTDLKAKPDTVLNSNDSSFNVYDKNISICFYRMKICCENEEIVSNLFHMYGYKVNRLMIPNTRSRVRFNYIKTLGANITGSINQNDLQELKSLFDNGITIWHYSAKDFNYLDYQFENMEVILV